MAEKYYCFRCFTKLKLETDKELKKTYKYFCPECDENMFSFEAISEEEMRKLGRITDHKKTKEQRGFYPIYAKDIRRMIGYCETWGYGNKDTCKYVAENIIERFSMERPDLKIKDSLHSDIISIVHDINSGARFSGREILIPLE